MFSPEFRRKIHMHFTFSHNPRPGYTSVSFRTMRMVALICADFFCWPNFCDVDADADFDVARFPTSAYLLRGFVSGFCAELYERHL